MDPHAADDRSFPELPTPFEVLAPGAQSLPLVVASPHSGSIYPRDFLTASRLDPVTLRRSEDCFVDELYGHVPTLGAPLIRALFPRAFVDVNQIGRASCRERVGQYV